MGSCGSAVKQFQAHLGQAAHAARGERLHAARSAQRLTGEERATLWVLRYAPLMDPERRGTLVGLVLALLACIQVISITMGCLADESVYGEAWRYFAPRMMALGMLTWALVIIRFAIGLWLNAKLSDFFANGVFFAVFVLLHVFAFMHVGLFAENAYFSSYSAVVRQLALPSSVSSTSGIFTWLDKFAVAWIPESFDSGVAVGNPAWATPVAPELWTARVEKRESCAYIGYNLGTCSPDLGSAGATEATGPWSPLPPEEGIVITHSSGEFEGSRGQMLSKPTWSGKLGKYTLGRGYRIFLTNPLTNDANPFATTLSNRSAFRASLSKLNQSSFIDDQTRLVFLSWLLQGQTLKQWLLIRVVFEISGASGRIEVTADILQGKVPWCEFVDPDTNARVEEELLRMHQRYDELGTTPECDSRKTCSDILEQLSTPEYRCHNIPDHGLWPQAMTQLLALRGFHGVAEQKWKIILAEAPVILLLLTWALTMFLLIDDLFEIAVQGLDYFKKAANYLDLLTMLVVFSIWLVEVQVESSLPSDAESWELMVHRQAQEHNRLGIAIFVWWFRLLNLVSRIHPRLRVLLLTVWDAVPDLFFFCVIFGLLLLSFTMTFHLWLGTRHESFTSVPTTFLTLFKGLLGDIDAANFEGSLEATVGYIVYATLSVLIMVNVFIAIVSESFNKAQERAAAKSRSRQGEVRSVEAWAQEAPTTEELAAGAVLKVCIWGARDLPASDANLMSDPYAVCGLKCEGDFITDGKSKSKKSSGEVKMAINGAEVTFPMTPARTSIVHHTLDPVWNAKASFLLPAGAALCHDLQLYVKVMDHDTLTTDDLLGEGTVPLPLLLGRSASALPPPHPSFGGGGAADGLPRHEVPLVHPVRSGTVSISAVLHTPDGRDGQSSPHHDASLFAVHPVGSPSVAGHYVLSEKLGSPRSPQIPGMLEGGG